MAAHDTRLFLYEVCIRCSLVAKFAAHHHHGDSSLVGIVEVRPSITASEAIVQVPWAAKKAGCSVQSRGATHFANADAVQRPVQGVQRIEQGLGFSFAAIAPQAFGHSVQGQDGVFYLCCSRHRAFCGWFAGHVQHFCGARQSGLRDGTCGGYSTHRVRGIGRVLQTFVCGRWQRNLRGALAARPEGFIRA